MTSATGTCKSKGVGRWAWGAGRSAFPQRPNDPTTRFLRRRRGFTLIEMLVLIIIMAVVSSVAVPAYARFYARTRFQQSVQQTVALLTWARDAAVQSGADSTVHFDPQTETFTVTVETPDPGTDAPTALQETAEGSAPPPDARAISLGENLAVTDFTVMNPLENTGLSSQAGAGRSEIHFHEDGSSDAARIVMRAEEGYGMMLEVVPTTGRVVVTDESEVQ